MLKSMMFIDGSNLFHVLRSICVEKQDPSYKIDFEALTKVHQNLGESKLIRIYYFTSAPAIVPEPQQNFFHRLEFAGVRVILGELRDSPEGYREKGVDVNIACHALKLSSHYDECCLLTHDQDLIPVSAALQDLGKTVTLWSYRTKTPARLLRSVDRTINMVDYWDILRVT